VIDPRDVVAVVLAAGLSRRFGPADKLVAPFRGKPLVTHAAQLTKQFPFRNRLAIVRQDSQAGAELSAQGLELRDNPSPGRGMGSSLAIAARAAEDLNAAACLILLGDMPNVTAALVQRLLDAFGAPQYVVTGALGQQRLPPTLFGAQHFAVLSRLSGDRGGSLLTKDAPMIAADETILADVDSVVDLQGA
jgi:molybdenum cofactor cytidylyltransferase